jgi:DNA modification methylase
MILNGDCLSEMKNLKSNSIDSIVTDPPYGLSFMGKKWDYDVPSKEIWIEALGVLKPGGHLLSFGGTRTYHRLVVAIEDAGFEIRDQIQWLYGSGFPKSQDVSKQIDKQAGATREVVGFNINHRTLKETNCMVGEPHSGDGSITAPATDKAKQWQGWGTALKPANEPICVARKPLEAKLTVAANVLKWGTGAINIDASRIGFVDEKDKKLGQSARPSKSKGMEFFTEGEHDQFDRSDRSQITGRWPANIILDEAAAEMLDAQSGTLKSGASKSSYIQKASENTCMSGPNYERQMQDRAADSGGASRFFYVAKASKRERNAGLEGMPQTSKAHIASKDGGGGGWAKDAAKNPNLPRANNHPTVKPIKLMEYLIKLVTPINGTVLDPFMGSGTTCVAAKGLGFKFVGIEMNSEYVEIAERRVEAVV